MDTPRIAGVVVLYNPDTSVLDAVQTYLSQIELLFAVDNSDTPSPEVVQALSLDPKIVYIANNGNRGIAQALNTGARHAVERGFAYLLTMDQDSYAAPDMIARMLEATAGFDAGRIGIIAPHHEVRGYRLRGDDAPWSFPLTVPTSGSLLNLRAFEDAGPFLEELFIDYVDVEYCLRLHSRGYLIVRVNGALLQHRLGAAAQYWIFFPTHHAPLRKYYKTRNRLYVAWKYRREHPGFYFSDKLRCLKEIVCVTLFEHEKLEKFKMMVRGWRDYRRGTLSEHDPMRELKVRVAFFTQASERGAASRYRVYQFIPYLRDHGIICRVYPAVPGWLHRIFFFSSNKAVKAVGIACMLVKRFLQVPLMLSADIIFFQKPVLPHVYPFIERCARFFRKKIIFDFDDAVFYRSPKWGARQGGDHIDVNFVRIMALADVVFAGNAHLARVASDYSTNVMLFPTVVNTVYYAVNPDRYDRQGPLVIGWIGSPTTAGYIGRLADVMERLAKQRDVTLKIIGARNISFPGVRVVCEDWSADRERDQLNSVDIGVAPLDDSEWSKGKCGLKILVYMACGIPVVASPYGVNRELIKDGINGFLAEDDDGWETALKALIDNATLRKRLGAEGRKTVEESYSLTAAARELAPFLKELGQNR